MVEGAVNLYHVHTEEGRAAGPRTFLFQVETGGLLFPLPDCDCGGAACFLAVPLGDCVVEPVREAAVLSPDHRRQAADWVRSCCRRLGDAHADMERLCSDLDADALRAFNTALPRRLDALVTAEKERARQASRLRYRQETARLQDALHRLAAVVPGKREKQPGTARHREEEPLIQACAIVAAELGMELSVPGRARGREDPDAFVSDIAAASRFRTREVALSDGWHRQDSGPLVGFLADGAPVALVQPHPRCYDLIDPAAGTRVRVTGAVAGQLRTRAIMFYRSLPARRLGTRDILSFAFAGAHGADWLWVLGMGVAGGLLAMLLPQVVGRVFDTVIPDGNRTALVQIGVLMMAMVLAGFAFDLTRAVSMQRISVWAERDLQSSVWDRILALPVRFFRDYPAGELAQRAMSISQIRGLLTGTAVNTMLAGIFSLFYIFVLFLKSPPLAWVGLGALAAVLAVSLLLSYLQIRWENTLIDHNNRIAGKLFGWLNGLPKIKISGSERRIFHNWAVLFADARTLHYRKEQLGNGSAVLYTIAPLLTSILIYHAVFRVEGAPIATGAFIAFNTALQKLLFSCAEVSRMVMDINTVLPLYRKAKPIFEATPEHDSLRKEPGALSGDIELSHIRFAYTPDGLPVIRDVSLHIKPGEHIALVGPSGCGKSTLLRILLGFEKPDSGEIYFDGASLDQLDVRAVRRQLGVVLQSGHVMDGSIFENVVGANPHLTMEDAMEALRQAGLSEEVAQMPMGLHTMVTNDGMGMSGGQRQRLLIARALANRPRILFFDEATSALDNQAQRLVSDSIQALNATRITIAHRLSTVQGCDRIVVLEDGAIVEQGTYAELMAMDGAFAAMARRQIA